MCVGLDDHNNKLGNYNFLPSFLVNFNFDRKKMSNKFVTESQIEEQKRQRQEEWNKTRKEDDPLGMFSIGSDVAFEC